MNDKKIKRRITLKAVTGLMEERYPLTWLDRGDDLDEHHDLLQKCLKQKDRASLDNQVDEWYWEQVEENIDRYLEELKDTCIAAGYNYKRVGIFFGKHEETLRERIAERDSSDTARDLLRRTDPLPVRVSMYSNYDCLNSHWFESYSGYSYYDSYFGDMVDALMLNPNKVRIALNNKGIKTQGRFPSLPSRHGKELVSYEDFMQELENSCCGANLLTFIGIIDPVALYDANFDLQQITIPKGNSCGLFSSMQGGGSVLEMTLLRDVTLSLERKGYDFYGLKIDHLKDKYSIGDTYGVIRSFWGENLRIAA